MAPLALTVLEIIILQIGAVILGMAIYFFYSSKKSLIESSPENIEKLKKQILEWREKYMNEIDLHGKEIINIRAEVKVTEAKHKKSLDEIEELNWKIIDLENRIEDAKSETGPMEKPAYLKQLGDAGLELRNQTEKINNLLSQVDFIKESEEKMQAVTEENERLKTKILNLESFGLKRDTELKQKSEKEEIYIEMSSMISNANEEFRTLRGKIQKLEAQLIDTQMDKLEFENIKEAYKHISKDHKELSEQNKKTEERNNRLTIEMNEAFEKLKESNFQRQQLQKKINYMDELKRDLHTMSDTNRSLESQLTRISELESMLNILSQEKNDQREDHSTKD